MDYKYKRAREELKISLGQLVNWINEDLAELGKTISIHQLFRIEEGLRKRYDVRTMIAEKYYHRIYSRWKKEQQIKEVDEKYGG